MGNWFSQWNRKRYSSIYNRFKFRCDATVRVLFSWLPQSLHRLCPIVASRFRLPGLCLLHGLAFQEENRTLRSSCYQWEVWVMRELLWIGMLKLRRLENWLGWPSSINLLFNLFSLLRSLKGRPSSANGLNHALLSIKISSRDKPQIFFNSLHPLDLSTFFQKPTLNSSFINLLLSTTSLNWTLSPIITKFYAGFFSSISCLLPTPPWEAA